MFLSRETETSLFAVYLFCVLIWRGRDKSVCCIILYFYQEGHGRDKPVCCILNYFVYFYQEGQRQACLLYTKLVCVLSRGAGTSVFDVF